MKPSSRAALCMSSVCMKYFTNIIGAAVKTASVITAISTTINTIAAIIIGMSSRPGFGHRYFWHWSGGFERQRNRSRKRIQVGIPPGAS